MVPIVHCQMSPRGQNITTDDFTLTIADRYVGLAALVVMFDDDLRPTGNLVDLLLSW
jgi:hypothetical protein